MFFRRAKRNYFPDLDSMTLNDNRKFFRKGISKTIHNNNKVTIPKKL